MRTRFFYGWWMVTACMITALVSNAPGLYGAGVYLRAVIVANGWTTSLVSGAITVYYGVSGLLLITVGGVIGRFGPRPVIACGGVCLAGETGRQGMARLP